MEKILQHTTAYIPAINSCIYAFLLTFGHGLTPN